MYKTFYILFLFLTVIPVSGQTYQENGYKLAFPENISSNSSFDISLIASNPFNDAENLVLYFNLSPRINFRSLELRTFYNVTDIPCRLISQEGRQGNMYRAQIDLNKNNISSKNYFQLLFTLKAENASTANFQFSGILKNQDETIGYIQSINNFDTEDTLKFSSVQLKFYKSDKLADNAVQLVSGSELKLILNDKNAKNILTEFWIKLNNQQTDFLKIINIHSGETLFDISTNPYQMITSGSYNQYTGENINPYFLSRGCWYHFAVLSSFDENKLSVFCDNNLIGSFELPSFLSTNDLQWKFENDSRNKSFQLDLLRFIDFNGDINLSYLNEHYLNFIGKNSSILYQLNFDNENELYAAKDVLNITYNALSYQRSDAPIFARAPELNINLLGNLYELTWQGGDYKQARSYILEKSINNSDFQQISSVQADNSYEKKYSLMDARDPSAEVIYYRLKQINIDGSTVYTSSVKIGQGVTEPFVLEQNYPNPFNPRTSIIVDLLEDSDVEITVYNLEGKEIAKLYKGFLTSGTHKFSFDASELPSGIYLYKVSTPNFSDTKKMILTK